MQTGKALEIVLSMANQLYVRHGELSALAKNTSEVEDALNIVEDLIVNNFAEEE